MKATGELQATIRRIDKAIQDLDPDEEVEVNVGDGKTETITGSELQKRWSKTTWQVVKEGSCCKNGTNGAEINSRGRFRTTSSYWDNFRQTAPGRGKTPEVASNSVVLHDFGHFLGRKYGIHKIYRGDSLGLEQTTSRVGRAIGNAIGVSFSCQTFNTGS